MSDSPSADKLLAILLEYAPDGPAQAKVTSIFNEMMDNLPDRNDVVKELAGMLYDGLHKGNWPWIDYTPLANIKRIKR